MIRVIKGRDRATWPRDMAAFHQLRKRVFFDSYGWDVPVIGGWEIDGYDALPEVAYLINIQHGRVVGGLRLLPTIGFNMLSNTFPELLREGDYVCSNGVWESSRFCIDRDLDEDVGPKKMSRAVAELGLGLNEWGADNGLAAIVTVYDAALHRHLNKIGCAGVPIGPTKRIGKCLALAASFAIGPAAAAATTAASGIAGPVLEYTRDPWRYAA